MKEDRFQSTGRRKPRAAAAEAAAAPYQALLWRGAGMLVPLALAAR
jgi:hypothetical protein